MKSFIPWLCWWNRTSGNGENIDKKSCYQNRKMNRIAEYSLLQVILLNAISYDKIEQRAFTEIKMTEVSNRAICYFKMIEI